MSCCCTLAPYYYYCCFALSFPHVPWPLALQVIKLLKPLPTNTKATLRNGTVTTTYLTEGSMGIVLSFRDPKSLRGSHGAKRLTPGGIITKSKVKEWPRVSPRSQRSLPHHKVIGILRSRSFKGLGIFLWTDFFPGHISYIELVQGQYRDVLGHRLILMDVQGHRIILTACMVTAHIEWLVGCALRCGLMSTGFSQTNKSEMDAWPVHWPNLNPN